MDITYLTSLLNRLRDGEIETATALEELKLLPYEDLSFARLDHHRALRNGFPEVVFGQFKTPEQIATIMQHLVARNSTVLCTRASDEAFVAVERVIPHAVYHALPRAIVVRNPAEPQQPGLPGVTVVSAGTADLPVAEEAALTAEVMGHTVERIYDIGVAGLHRVLAVTEQLRQSHVVVTVAGMEGALASVVGGLVDIPVIAVPTSVGYGASFGGLAALLAMLNSCAAGIAVVNIDNGFGAGVMAAMINRQTVPLATPGSPTAETAERG